MMKPILHDYTPHPILGTTSEKLMEITLAKIKEVNPRLKIGEQIRGGQEKVWQGKVFEEYLTQDPLVSFDELIEPGQPRPHVKCSRSKEAKIYFEDPLGFEMFKEFSGYVHPIVVAIPHQKWLLAKVPGETVNLTDKDYNVVPYVLTKDDFNKHSYVIFRFAISDQ